MIPVARSVDSLRKRRPEWSPWLAVVDEVQREAMTARWETAVPSGRREMEAAAPLLSGTIVRIDEDAARRMLLRLVDIASRGGTAKMAALRPALGGGLEIAVLFRASLRHDTDTVATLAATASADADALQAVVSLVAVPFLHACARAWRPAVPMAWMQGYCPICASWPAFAEMRGIERSRMLRCGRCGSEWHGAILRCAYCGNHDHNELATLVAGQNGSTGDVEACRRCRQYVKVLTRLQGCAPGEVMLEEMATVDLDIAAIQSGYTRPVGAGRDLDVDVQVAPRVRRLFTGQA